MRAVNVKERVVLTIYLVLLYFDNVQWSSGHWRHHGDMASVSSRGDNGVCVVSPSLSPTLRQK